MYNTIDNTIYEVYYVLKNSYQKHIMICTNDIEKAIDCYCNFLFDNCLLNTIDYCLLKDNRFGKRLLYTEFRLV